MSPATCRQPHAEHAEKAAGFCFGFGSKDFGKVMRSSHLAQQESSADVNSASAVQDFKVLTPATLQSDSCAVSQAAKGRILREKHITRNHQL